MLKIENVCKSFNAGTVNEKVVFEDFNLTIESGEFVTVIGGNGSGKSTLMNLVSGAYKVDKGSINLDDFPLSKKEEYEIAPYIGRVFQDPLMGTCSNLSIAENLSLAKRKGQRRTLRKGITEQEKKEYKEILSGLSLGLEDRLTSKVGLLSGGQRQALTLVMATLVKPKLLLLDEHTAALDPRTASKVLDLTKKVVEKDQLTTLMITHNMKDALTYGNRLIMMEEGKIILDIKGEEKKRATISDLLEKFEKNHQEIDEELLLG